MYSRILPGVVLLAQLIVSSTCDTNVTSENKSKRGIYDLGDGVAYNVLPIQHLATYTQVRALQQGETPIETLEQADNQYIPVYDTQRISVTDNLYNGQTYQPQQLAYSPHNRIQVPQQLALQNIIKEQQSVTPHQQHASQHHSAQHHAAQQHAAQQATQQQAAPHSVNDQPKLAATPLTFYGTDKQVNNFVGHLRPAQELKLAQYANAYSTIPTIYAQPQGNLQTIKLIQPTHHSQLNHLPLPTIHQPLQQYANNHPPNKVSTNIQLVTNTQQRTVPTQQTNQHPSSPMSQISHNFKAIQPNFFQPQVFDNPVVPQLQHYIPRIQNPFDAFTKPIRPSPVIPEKPSSPPPTRSSQERKNEDDEEEDDDEDVKRKTKEEVQGEVVHEEENSEERFEKGYKDAARGFPAYDRDDDYDYRRAKNYADDGKYDNYRSSSRYVHDHDHDDDDHDGYHRDHDYDDDRHHYYNDHDHEGSQHHHKQEPRENHREAPPRPSKPQREHKHKKEYKKTDSSRDERRDDRQLTKRPSNPPKYYKSSSNNHYSRRPHSDRHESRDSRDSRQAGSSPRKQSIKTVPYPKSTKDVVLTPPKYHYGFEPIRSPYAQGSKEVDDSVARHSSPESKKKIYRENWYLSKSSES